MTVKSTDPWLMGLARSSSGTERLMAISVLTSLYKSDLRVGLGNRPWASSLFLC